MPSCSWWEEGALLVPEVDLLLCCNSVESGGAQDVVGGEGGADVGALISRTVRSTDDGLSIPLGVEIFHLLLMFPGSGGSG